MTTHYSYISTSQFIEMFPFKENPYNWPELKFVDFASIDATMTTDFEKYADYPHIGIDSIEQNTGRLSGYRTVSEDNVKSGKYIFTPKHIIYSKIRPNLNKVATPDFEGLCSADSYPILAKEEVMSKEFLTYLMRSDTFLKYIVPLSNRTGMPKVNRDQVEGFTIPVPPLSLQREFVVIASQADKSGFEGIKSQFIEMFHNSVNDKGTLGDYCVLKSGKNIKTDLIIENPTDGYFPCYGGNGIRGYVTTFSHDGKYCIIGRQGAWCGNIQIAKGKFYATEHAVVVTPKIEIEPVWLYYALASMNLNQYARGVAQPGLAVNQLEKLPFEIPELDLQEQFVEIAEQADKSGYYYMN